jgi:hypothetical protein
MAETKIEVGGFSGDPMDALNPPAATGGCCGGAPSDAAGQTSTCCGTAAEATAEGSCCGSAAKADAVASGAGCCG